MRQMAARRLWALCRKESFQIVRDPSSILIAFVMPVILLFTFGYAINLDASRVSIGILNKDNGPAALHFVQTLQATPVFAVRQSNDYARLFHEMSHGKIRGIVIIENDFSSKWLQGQGAAAISVLTDGGEPNTANFVAAYIQGAWESWRQSMRIADKLNPQTKIDIRVRSWFNPSTVSRNFLVPGSISIVMTVIGALLTSLVIAREWERGTMEALLAAPITRGEFLLSKILPYYVLGIIAMILCLLIVVFIMHIPFRGSLFVLLGISSLFLGCALGLGLFLSTTLRTQFDAAQIALTSAFLPAVMLSGFVFELSSMPRIIQWLSHIIPARYFANSLQTLFQAGNIASILVSNAIYLTVLMLFWLALTALKTRRTLD